MFQVQSILAICGHVSNAERMMLADWQFLVRNKIQLALIMPSYCLQRPGPPPKRIQSFIELSILSFVSCYTTSFVFIWRSTMAITTECRARWPGSDATWMRSKWRQIIVIKWTLTLDSIECAASLCIATIFWESHSLYLRLSFLILSVKFRKHRLLFWETVNGNSRKCFFFGLFFDSRNI